MKRLLLLSFCLLFACRRPATLAAQDDPGATDDASCTDSGGVASTLPEATNDGGGASPPAESAAGANGGGASSGSARPPLVTCQRESAPDACSFHGDSRRGLRLIGTLLEPTLVRARGVLDLDANGDISCAACDCGDAGEKLVIDCPSLVISPGFINLHDHLGYAGTPPLAHPGELYEHRNDWRLGEHGHAALAFSGGASTTQVLAHELRMLLGGATATVGAGGRRGWLRNLEMQGQSQGLLAGRIVAETFPLDDARGSVDSASCAFGAKPDTAAVTDAASAYLAHVGEGTDARASDELRCALGSLNLLGANSAVVHAMALTRADAIELARRGASVVWSPRSNLDLYGQTAPVALLGSLGVRIALGTDWLASGSMNLQRELACARDYDAAVLGGYFDAFQRWRMVTEHASWALGLERRFASLRVGLAGDVAVFAGHDVDPYADAVQAKPADLTLLLRQGTPLYGDAGVVAAFRDGEACEELDVCGAARRVCSLETGHSLAEIQTSAEAVYPLFSCETPPQEPHCEASVSRECAWGEADCQAPPTLPAWDATDADADGVSDVYDVCPRAADPEQADADADGHGDACDACPVPNPGLTPCPLSIAQLRAPASRLAPLSAVRLSQVRVTALRSQGSKGYYVEDGDHAQFSGIFVYTGSAAPGVELDEIVTLQGYFDTFQGVDELVGAELLERAPAATPYPALLLPLADLSDGSTRADGLASLLVRIEAASVELTNPDAPKDYDETLLWGGVRLDDLLYPDLDNLYPVSSHFSALQGIAGLSFGHQKLYPRFASDVTTDGG